jgi:hypothetical protein
MAMAASASGGVGGAALNPRPHDRGVARATNRQINQKRTMRMTKSVFVPV